MTIYNGRTVQSAVNKALESQQSIDVKTQSQCAALLNEVASVRDEMTRLAKQRSALAQRQEELTQKIYRKLAELGVEVALSLFPLTALANRARKAARQARRLAQEFKRLENARRRGGRLPLSDFTLIGALTVGAIGFEIDDIAEIRTNRQRVKENERKIEQLDQEISSLGAKNNSPVSRSQSLGCDKAGSNPLLT